MSAIAASHGADIHHRITDLLQRRPTGSIANFRDFELGSHFQPIYSLAHQRPIGYEALLRARNHTGKMVSPLTMFKLPKSQEEFVHLDRICRALHTCNFRKMPRAKDRWLFLNIDPSVAVNGKRYGSFFKGMLAHFDMPPQRVVVEILEAGFEDRRLLEENIRYYKEMGCLIAIDDFGAGHSNFDRIWRLEPDIIKLDRSIINQAASNARARRLLPGLVELVHETGALSLVEGIETRQEALLAMDAGVKFVQGYYFGRPAAINTRPEQNESRVIANLFDCFQCRARDDAKRMHQRLNPYIHLLKQSAADYLEGDSLETSCAPLLAADGVERCYLMNGDGIQIGDNLTPAHSPHLSQPKFPLLDTADSANWSHMHYFRNAVTKPGEVQVSRTYLSLSGANMCKTLSLAVRTERGLHVLCCDIFWEETHDWDCSAQDTCESGQS